jgi:hypothetical protein
MKAAAMMLRRGLHQGMLPLPLLLLLESPS